MFDLISTFWLICLVHIIFQAKDALQISSRSLASSALEAGRVMEVLPCSNLEPKIRALRLIPSNIQPNYQYFVYKLVNWPKVRTNLPQSSDFGFKAWTRRVSFASECLGSAGFQTRSRNLSCIFCLEKYPFIRK